MASHGRLLALGRLGEPVGTGPGGTAASHRSPAHTRRTVSGWASGAGERRVRVASSGSRNGVLGAGTGPSGARVVGVRAVRTAHDAGPATGDQTVRQAYFEDPRYVPLLLRSYEIWTSWVDHRTAHLTGRRPHGRTGGRAVVTGTVASATRWQIPHEYSTPGRRPPVSDVRLGADELAVFEPGAASWTRSRPWPPM